MLLPRSAVALAFDKKADNRNSMKTREHCSARAFKKVEAAPWEEKCAVCPARKLLKAPLGVASAHEGNPLTGGRRARQSQLESGEADKVFENAAEKTIYRGASRASAKRSER